MAACLQRRSRMAVFRGTRLISDDRTAKTCLYLLVGSIVSICNMWTNSTCSGWIHVANMMTVLVARSRVIGFRCDN